MLSALPLPSGDLGIYWTVANMRAMVYREYMSPLVRLTAVNIVAGISGKDEVEQAQAIRDWIETHTEFIRDPDGGEMLHGPIWQLRHIRQYGVVRVDCDDVAILSAALGKAIGLRARFVVLALGSRAYRHVFTELSPRGVTGTSGASGGWVDMDVTRDAQMLPHGVSRFFIKDV